MNYIEVDAKGLSAGRVASQVASILNGKHDTDFMPNRVTQKKVRVINISKMVLTGDKLNQKSYYSHSGYPGALKRVPIKDMLKGDPSKLFLRILSGMISNNRLKNDKLKNLKLEA